MEHENKSLDSATIKRLKPFLRLGAYFDPDFCSLVEKLLFLLREYGLAQVEQAPREKAEWDQFFCAVHDGWNQAQDLIAAHLADEITRHELCQARVTLCHKEKRHDDKKVAIRELRVVGMKILVLRRMLDSIAWTIFKGEHSTIRRLQVNGGASNLSIKNIEDALPVARAINENPLKMALCTDMSTFIHIGDLLLFDLGTGQISFVEVKSGDKNVLLSKIAGVSVEHECAVFDEQMNNLLDDTDRKHLERAKRQYARNKTVVDTITNEGGTDHNTGATVRISPTNLDPQLYSEKILACRSKLSDTKQWAIATIDRCLHIGVYSNQEVAYVGFNAWMDTISCISPIFNLTDSFVHPLVRPFASLPLPTELLMEVWQGKITIMLCFDVKAFMEMANDRYPGYMYLADKRSTAEARRLKQQLLELNGRVVQVNSRDGVFSLGKGISDRIVFDLQRPADLLKMHRTTFEGEVESRT